MTVWTITLSIALAAQVAASPAIVWPTALTKNRQSARPLKAGCDEEIKSAASERKVDGSPAADPYLPPPGHTLQEIEVWEQECFEAVNGLRKARGLAELQLSKELLQVARDYSRRMAGKGFFSHVDTDGLSVRDRMSKAGIRWSVIGENLSYSLGYVNPVAVSIRDWMNSPGHRRNILEAEFEAAAVGAWVGEDGTVYFTQIFLRDRK